MVNEWRCRRALRGVEEGLYGAWLEAPRIRERIPKGAHKGAELRQLVCIGGFVDAVQGWHTESGQVCRHRAIGQQHKLLDQHMRPSTLGAYDSIDPALAVEDDVSLGQVKVETPRGKALLT